MEYNVFAAYSQNHLPSHWKKNHDFVQYYADETNELFAYADMFMQTLPSPRYSYYQSSDFDTIVRNVETYSNEIVDALGYFPIEI